jgi:hypothetical protein
VTDRVTFVCIAISKSICTVSGENTRPLSLYTYNGAYPTSDHNISQSLMAVTQTPMEHNSHFHIHVWYIIGGRI